MRCVIVVSVILINENQDVAYLIYCVVVVWFFFSIDNHVFRVKTFCNQNNNLNVNYNGTKHFEWICSEFEIA